LGLSIAGKQLVEIAKALSYEASVLIMDEPTAVLSEQETANLFALIGELKGKGVAILYISHRLAEVETICDRISVFRDGKLVQSLGKGEANQAEMANLMVGRPLGDMFPARTVLHEPEAALEVEMLSEGAFVRDVSFRIGAGEIIGLAGLIGSGRTEVAEAIVGARDRLSGRIRVSGKAADPRSPKSAARCGIAYVSEDRKGAGLVMSMRVTENTTLANLAAYAKPFVNRSRERAATIGWKERLDIRAHDLDASILYLSGGNQQKVAIAKWLELGPKVLILDEPTRGVDVGAKREIYALIHELASRGMACLVISSELPELLGLCHRILVMREGRIVGEVTAEEATEETVMAMAAGVRAA
jgi:ribose transport system ATP-binding protein